MSKPKTGTSYNGAILRMQRDERLAAQSATAPPDPRAEAERHERYFLAAMGAAKEHFDWIIGNSAWIALGHETFASWWEARVMPIAIGLGMRPTQDIAKTVIDKVREEEAALPKAQRRTQQEIAAMVGLDRSALSSRDGSRSLPRENSRQSDLEEPPADPLTQFPAVEDAVNQHFANQTSGLADDTSPVDESGEDRPAPPSPGEAGDGGPSSAADVSIPSATPTDPTSSPEEKGSVDEPEQREEGVPPAAPATPPVDEAEPDPCDRVVAALRGLAEEYEALDVDVLGPLLTSAHMAAIDKELNRVVAIVELLIRWNERAQA